MSHGHTVIDTLEREEIKTCRVTVFWIHFNTHNFITKARLTYKANQNIAEVKIQGSDQTIQKNCASTLSFTGFPYVATYGSKVQKVTQLDWQYADMGYICILPVHSH